jgi:hypothetical protein
MRTDPPRSCHTRAPPRMELFIHTGLRSVNGSTETYCKVTGDKEFVEGYAIRLPTVQDNRSSDWPFISRTPGMLGGPSGLTRVILVNVTELLNG